MITWRGDFVDAMKKMMYDWFFETYDALPTVYDQIFEVRNSDGAYEVSGNLQALGDLVEKPEGDDIVFEKVQQGRIKYVKNRTFAKGVEFTKEQVEDMPTWVAGQIRDYAATWGDAVKRTKEKFGANFFNYGGYTSGNDIFNGSVPGVITDPSGDLCYDGKPLFNLSGNTRSSLNGGTYYNAVALTFSQPNLQTLYNLMTLTNNRNENDEKISIVPTTLIHNGALKFTAAQVLLSTNIPGNANNDINPVQNIVTPLVWQYLDTDTMWVLGTPKKGLVWYERQMPVLNFFQDPKNKNYYATIDVRWGAGVTDWRYWAASNAPTS